MRTAQGSTRVAAHGSTVSDTAAYDEVAGERHFTELFRTAGQDDPRLTVSVRRARGGVGVAGPV